MKKLNIKHMLISELCLGGGKYVHLNEEQGRELALEAINQGINVFDAHHRYGLAEKVFGKIINPELVKMTKVSAYQEGEHFKLLSDSSTLLDKIDILWISDLDDPSLYEKGVRIYTEIKLRYGSRFEMGITTEDPGLAYRFMAEYPECDLFMVPVYLGIDPFMFQFLTDAKKNGKFTFAIKPFLDGRLLEEYTIADCLEALKQSDIHVTIFGTKKVDHLREIIQVWETL